MAALLAKFGPQLAQQATKFAADNPQLLEQAKGMVAESGEMPDLSKFVNAAADNQIAQEGTPPPAGMSEDLLAALVKFYKEVRLQNPKLSHDEAKAKMLELLTAITDARGAIEARGLGGKRKKTKKSKRRGKKTLRRKRRATKSDR